MFVLVAHNVNGAMITVFAFRSNYGEFQLVGSHQIWMYSTLSYWAIGEKCCILNGIQPRRMFFLVPVSTMRYANFWKLSQLLEPPKIHRKLESYFFMFFFFVDLQILVWDVSSRAILQTINCHVDMIYSMAVNRNGSFIATTSKDKKLRVIEPRNGIVISVSILLLHFYFLECEAQTIKKHTQNNTERHFLSISENRRAFVIWEPNVRKWHFWITINSSQPAFHDIQIGNLPFGNSIIWRARCIPRILIVPAVWSHHFSIMIHES